MCLTENRHTFNGRHLFFHRLIGYPPQFGRDDPVLSERDRRELMNLVNENISMDFILEMKEAFQLFDKVSVIKKIEIGNCNSYQKSK